MRRDEGKYLKVTEATKVCSRHFRPREIKKTLAGKNEPRAGVVPSVFEWIRTSPRKRKDPIAQNFEIPPSKAAHKLNFSSVDLTDDVLDSLLAQSNVSVLAAFHDESEGEPSRKLGRPRNLRPIDEYFAVMCRLRQGLPEEHLAHLLKVSLSTVSRVFITWLNFMYLRLGQINIWPSRTAIDKTMPEDFKKKYSSTRVIIDCTEVRCQIPSSLQLNGELFSNYKHRETLKGLIGISPGGAITFISQLYTGSISDREIVARSGFLDLPFEDNDSVMADKGFTIQDLLPMGVSFNIPPFLGSSSQMPAEDVVKIQETASLRIHVECAINKIQNFHIWDGVIPLHQLGLANQMRSVCAILCNVQPNIISI